VVEFKGIQPIYKPCDPNECHNDSDKNCCPINKKNTSNSDNKITNFSEVLYNLTFSLPIHLRYHSPHSKSPHFSIKLGRGMDISRKIVTIKNPDIYISYMNRNNNNDNKSSSNKYPMVTRIFDMSFLGQRGNLDLLDGCTYVRIPNKHSRVGDHSDHRKDFNHADRDHSDTINHVDNENDKDFLQEINLSIPVGHVKHSYVLFVTVCCYLCTASAILYSLIV
jgi:hypothetical protein